MTLKTWKAAVHLVRCYVRDNKEAQEMLIATMAPISVSPDEVEGFDAAQSFGGLLVRALLGKCSPSNKALAIRASGRAAGVLSLLLMNNGSAKQRCLRTPIGIDLANGGRSIMLMPKLVDYMQEAPLESETVAVAELLQCIMMATLTVWLHECPHAVRAFLSNPMNFPQIVDLITDKATAMAGGGVWL